MYKYSKRVSCLNSSTPRPSYHSDSNYDVRSLERKKRQPLFRVIPKGIFCLFIFLFLILLALLLNASLTHEQNPTCRRKLCVPAKAGRIPNENVFPPKHIYGRSRWFRMRIRQSVEFFTWTSCIFIGVTYQILRVIEGEMGFSSTFFLYYYYSTIKPTEHLHIWKDVLDSMNEILWHISFSIAHISWSGFHS